MQQDAKSSAVRKASSCSARSSKNAQLGISFLSIDGRTVFSNRAWHQILGYTADELSNLDKWVDILHPDDRASGAERYAKLIDRKAGDG